MSSREGLMRFNQTSTLRTRTEMVFETLVFYCSTIRSRW